MGRVDDLEGIDDPVQVRGTLSFVTCAEDVKQFVAALETMQDSLTRWCGGFIFQSLQPGE